MNNYVHNMLMSPWPNVGQQTPDRSVVRMLFSVYAGASGEMTAVSQYFYNSLITGNRGEQDISELFACVSANEMTHLKQLGKLILCYGGDPRLLHFATGHPAWWSSGMLRYAQGTEIMLKQAIAAERTALQDYKRLAQHMEPEPRALIERIAQDEAHHLELFQRALGRDASTVNERNARRMSEEPRKWM